MNRFNQFLSRFLILKFLLGFLERSCVCITPSINLFDPQMLVQHLMIKDIFDQQGWGIRPVKAAVDGNGVGLRVISAQPAFGTPRAPHQPGLLQFSCEFIALEIWTYSGDLV